MEGFLPARSGHTLALLDESTLFCVGGYDGTRRFGDAWCMDCDTELWTEMAVDGDAFRGRAGHVMGRSADGSFVIGLGYASDRELLGCMHRMRVSPDRRAVAVERIETKTSIARRWASAAMLDVGLVVACGWNETGPLNGQKS